MRARAGNEWLRAYFCKPQASLAEIVCSREAESRDPHEIGFPVLSQPGKQPAFIRLIVAAVICLIFPVAVLKQSSSLELNALTYSSAKAVFPLLLPLFPVGDRRRDQLFQQRCPFMPRYFSQFLQISLQVLIALDIDKNKISMKASHG